MKSNSPLFVLLSAAACALLSFGASIEVVVSGNGTVSGGGTYAEGRRALLRAVPAKGYAFAGWYTDSGFNSPLSLDGGDYRDSVVSLPVYGNQEVVARFIHPREDWLEVFESDYSFEVGERLWEDDVNLRECVESGSLPTLAVKGLPPGLTYNSQTGCLVGRPTRPGTYYITLEAKNTTGYKFTQIQRFNVEPLPENAVDLPGWAYPLEAFVDADLYLRDEVELEFPAGIEVKLSGLPPGLRAGKTKYWMEGVGDVSVDAVLGRPSKVGVYTVKAVMKNPGNPRETCRQEMKVVVHDLGSRYVEVLAGDDGTVSGSGVYPVGATVKLSAKPTKEQAFMGWKDMEGATFPFEEGADSRNPSAAFVLGADNVSVVASFGALGTLDGWGPLTYDGPTYWEVGPEEGEIWESFQIISPTLPKITVKGLPSGFSFAGEKDCSEDWYFLRFDGRKTPAPGVYPFVVSAQAQHMPAMEPVTGYIQVRNLEDDAIPVSDYYEFEPGVASEEEIPDAAGCSVSGLPPGMKWDAARCVLTGTCTKPGYYTLTFTKTVGGVKHVATSTIEVLPYPALVVRASAGGAVSGSGNYPAGSKVTLKATPRKGFVFAGWYADPDYATPVELASGDYRDPALTFVTDVDDTELYAGFLPVEDDFCHEGEMLWAPDMTYEFAQGEPIEEIRLDEVFSSGSLPTFTVSGLPDGLKFDAKTRTISGTPRKRGWFTPVFSAKNASGYACAYVVKMSVDAWDPAEDYEQSAAAEGLLGMLHVRDGATWLGTGRFLWAGHPVLSVEASVYSYSEHGYKENSKEATTISVTGLPPGLKLQTKAWKESWKEGGVSETRSGTDYYLSGAPTKAGRYTVTVTETYTYEQSATGEPSEKGSEKYVTKFDVYVYQDPSMYVRVEVSPDADGKVHGLAGTSGVYPAGAVLTPTVKADKGYVFAGWNCNGEDGRGSQNVYAELNGQDGSYTVASQGWFVGHVTVDGSYWGVEDVEYQDEGMWAWHDGPLLSGLTARFIPVERDNGIVIMLEGEGDRTLDEADVWDLDEIPVLRPSAYSQDFAGTSGMRGSHATITAVTGLPKGLVVKKLGSAVTEISRPDGITVPPGRYDVTFTARNLSGVTERMTLPLVVHNEWNDFFGDLDQSDEGYVLSVGNVGAFDPLCEVVGSIYREFGGRVVVTFSGLPAGVTIQKDTSFSSSSGFVCKGAPSKPGFYTVTIKASGTGWEGEKINETATFFVTVNPLPAWLVGSFHGGVRREVESYRGNYLMQDGNITFSISSNGKVSGAYSIRGSKTAFSSAGLASVDDNEAFVSISTGIGGHPAQFDIVVERKSLDSPDGPIVYGTAEFTGSLEVAGGEESVVSFNVGQDLFERDVASRLPVTRVLNGTVHAADGDYTIRVDEKGVVTAFRTDWYGRTASLGSSKLVFQGWEGGVWYGTAVDSQGDIFYFEIDGDGYAFVEVLKLA